MATTMTIEECKTKYPMYDQNLPWFNTNVGSSFSITKEMRESKYAKIPWDTARQMVGHMGYKYRKEEGEDGSLTFTRYA